MDIIIAVCLIAATCMLVLMGIAVINTLSSIRGYFVSKTITQSMINRDLHNHELTTKELRR